MPRHKSSIERIHRAIHATRGAMVQFLNPSLGEDIEFGAGLHAWMPVMSIMHLAPGTVVRDRERHREIGWQVITDRSARLIRFGDQTVTTVAAAKRYLEYRVTNPIR